MPRLADALREKYATPEQAIIALGLDASLIQTKETKPMTKHRLSRTAAVAKGALMAHLRPVLAADAKLNLDAVLADVTHKNFAERKGDILKAVHKVASTKLASGATLAMDAMEKVMDVAEKEAEDEEEEDKEKKAKDAKEMPVAGKSALDKARDDFKDFIKEKKMSKDDFKKACDAMESDPDAWDEEEEVKVEEEEDKEDEAKKKAAKDKAAKDAAEEADKEKEKAAKDAKQAMDQAIRAERENGRAIRIALDEVEPWVGKLSATLAMDSKTDVYRHAAVMLGVDGAKTLHPDALLPIIKAQPKPGDKQVHPRRSSTMGLDASSIDGALKIAPGLSNIRVGM